MKRCIRLYISVNKKIYQLPGFYNDFCTIHHLGISYQNTNIRLRNLVERKLFEIFY